MELTRLGLQQHKKDWKWMDVYPCNRYHSRISEVCQGGKNMYGFNKFIHITLQSTDETSPFPAIPQTLPEHHFANMFENTTDRVRLLER